MDLREIEIKDGDVDWIVIGTGSYGSLRRIAYKHKVVLRSFNLSFDPSLALPSMNERRHWSSKLAISCGCAVHEFSYYGLMMEFHLCIVN